jgi:hypothetical protein
MPVPLRERLLRISFRNDRPKARFEAEWYDWNATMLLEVDESSTDNFTGGQLADHIGTPKTSGKADNPVSPKTPQAQGR